MVGNFISYPRIHYQMNYPLAVIMNHTVVLVIEIVLLVLSLRFHKHMLKQNYFTVLLTSSLVTFKLSKFVLNCVTLSDNCAY